MTADTNNYAGLLCGLTPAESESRLGAVLNTIADGVFVIDAAGTIFLVNAALERLFGYDRAELLGASVGRLLPFEELRQRFLEAAPAEGRARTGGEILGTAKSGAAIPVHLELGEMGQAGQRLFVGVIHDLTPGKRAELRLRMLSGAVEQSPNAILIASLEGRVEYANLGFQRLTGYPAPAVVGKHLDAEPRWIGAPVQFARRFESLIRGSGEWRGEVRDFAKSGAAYWALESITPLRDFEGNIAHFLITRQDITEQKSDKEALQESEQRFRQVAKMAGEWLWEQDDQGRYTYCSAAVEDILGYRPEDIIGQHYLNLLTPEDRAHWMTALPASPNIPRPFHRLVNRYRHKDGHEVFTESTGEPILDEGGAILKWRGVDHDITARKRYEDAVHLRERAIDAANVGLAILDAQVAEQPTIYVNPAFCEMTGYAREELIGRAMRPWQGPDLDPEALSRIDEAFRLGQRCSVVLRIYRKDGTAFWSDLLISPVQDDVGRLTHFIAVQTDITERRRAEEARRELDVARQIQHSLLPKTALRLDGLEAAGICLPVGHLGGDYYDYFVTDEGLDLIIADVSGHSVGAALIMTETRSALRVETRSVCRERHRHGAAEMLGVLNELLYEDLSGADLFVTMFYLAYDRTARRLCYANAGHNQALLVRGDQTEYALLDAEGLILGVKPEVAYEEKTLLLKPGDVVLLYTDGVVEARNPEGEFFGLDRLAGQLFAQCRLPVEDLVAELLARLRKFCAGGTFQDDITLVVLKVL